VTEKTDFHSLFFLIHSAGMLSIPQNLFTDHLCAISLTAGISLSRSEAVVHYKHAAALLEWNKRFNLTALTAAEDIIIKHIVDSLMVSRFVALQGSLADIGAGGGYPGIPLKIHVPELTVTLVEANRKKANFLRFAVRSLGLEGITVYQGRVEAYDALANFDCIVSRAFADMATFCACAQPLLKHGGILVCMLGGKERAKQQSRPPENRWRITQTHTYALPRNKGNRRLFVLSRKE
jgi:16S rRNA (guanine527-N7)-methyltransferase